VKQLSILSQLLLQLSLPSMRRCSSQLSILSQLLLGGREYVQRFARAGLPLPFNSFPVAARRAHPPFRVRRPVFQFFPSCCPEAAGGEAGAEGRLSILSQLLLFASSNCLCTHSRQSFQFFPSCCCSKLLQAPSSARIARFQFFPSCCGKRIDYLTCSETEETKYLFQFFPSCCRGLGSLLPYKPFLRELRSS
jgi:hypothetical protein